MKKCSYCGAEYSDDAVVCSIDQTPLQIALTSATKPHSAIGIASFVVSIIVGCLMVALLFGTAILVSQRIPGERTYPGQTFVGLGFIFLLMIDVVAVGLGIASLFQTVKNRLFGILGLVFAGATVAGVIGLMILGLMFAVRAPR
jgi:ABC-type sugar transport system permease subunit